jgi:hypothetical protein
MLGIESGISRCGDAVLILLTPIVIRGSGGLRKVRFGLGSRGQERGGARVIYLFSGESVPVFIVAVFAKNEKANLSAAERNALAKMIADMVEKYRRRK